MSTDPISSRRILIPGSKASFSYEFQGLPVSQEALYLCRFALDHSHNCVHGLDLGCGCGLLAIVMALENPLIRFHALDIQAALIDIARNNCRTNHLDHRITCSVADIRDVSSLPEQNSIDLVIANPPFRKKDTGRISPDTARSVSCHEITGSLNDYVRAASIVLKARAFFATVTIPERFLELMETMHLHRVKPCIVQFIHHHATKPANAVLVMGRKNGHSDLMILPPVVSHSNSFDSMHMIDS